MSTEENKTIIRRYFQEVLNEGKIEVVDELVATEVALHQPPFRATLHGLEVLKQLIGYNRTVFPDRRVDIEDIVAEADKVAVRGTFRGTYHGAPLGHESPRKIADGVMPVVLVSGMAIFRIDATKIAEVWTEEDFVEALRQLGIPAVFPPELALVKGWTSN
jgi:predicted ester cyclase